MYPRRLSAATLALVVALVAGACTDDGSDVLATNTTRPPVSPGELPTTTPSPTPPALPDEPPATR
ncbi:MAG: hypothetical protein ACRDGW_12420, partial [Actinomycetota bacterium]